MLYIYIDILLGGGEAEFGGLFGQMGRVECLVIIYIFCFIFYFFIFLFVFFLFFRFSLF